MKLLKLHELVNKNPINIDEILTYYRENILKELKIACTKRVDLDNNEYLLGFENGVYDLKNRKFRKIKNHFVYMLYCI